MIEPSIADILAFAEFIGIPGNWIMPRSNLRHWSYFLHEVGHFAVKPDWYIQHWLSTGPRLGEIPDLRMEDDPTCDDFAVCLWQQGVLKYFGWPCPNTLPGGDHCPVSWTYEGLLTCRHLWHLETPEEALAKWGIDPLKGVFRPSVDWYPAHHFTAA